MLVDGHVRVDERELRLVSAEWVTKHRITHKLPEAWVDGFNNMVFRTIWIRRPLRTELGNTASFSLRYLSISLMDIALPTLWNPGAVEIKRNGS